MIKLVFFLVGLLALSLVIFLNFRRGITGTTITLGTATGSSVAASILKAITFKRIVAVACIIAAIIIGKNVAAWFLGKVAIVDEKTVVFQFAPNIWNQKDFGWREIEGLQGRNVVRASGSYRQYFINRYPDPYLEVYPTGIPDWKAPYEDKLPMPDRPVGCMIGRIGRDGVPFYIGREMKMLLPKGKKLQVTVNLPQNYAEKGDQADVFRQNLGAFKIEIKRIE